MEGAMTAKAWLANLAAMGFGLALTATTASAQIVQGDTIAPFADTPAADAAAPDTMTDTTSNTAIAKMTTTAPAPSSLAPGAVHPAVAPNAEIAVPLSPGVNNVPGF